MKKYINRLFPEKFDKIWKKIRNTEKIDSTLKYITDSFIVSDSYKTVSNYWHIRNIKSFETLSKFGMENYGSTIAPYYFTFTELYHDEWFMDVVKNLENVPFNVESKELFKKHKNFSLRESISYNYLCYLLFYSLKQNPYYQHLENLNDKTYLGFDDPYVTINDIKISTDKVASLFDCEKIFKTFEKKKINRILEIGAGSGRTSEAILSINKEIKYVICDIPPAIYISYKRLKIAFPNKKISLMIDSNNEDELNKKIQESDISFIFPDHLRLLEKKFIDLTIAIDCLHEMDKKTIQYYLNKINSFSKSFYFSVWEKTEVPYSKNIFKKQNTLSYYNGDYKIPASWDEILNENLIFPSNQLALGFKIKD